MGIFKYFLIFCLLWGCSTSQQRQSHISSNPHKTHKLRYWDVSKNEYFQMPNPNSNLKYNINSEAKAALDAHQNEWETLELAWPTSGTLTSVYGIRKLRQQTRMHNGIDIGTNTGTPVYAAETGRVKFKGQMRGYGKSIILKHDSVHDTLYAHLNRITIKRNQMVRKNQLIGYVGRTGYTTGANLHFEMRIRGTAKNPLEFLPKSDSKKEVRVGEAIIVKNRHLAIKSSNKRNSSNSKS